jgi:hypothetical protein
MHYYPVWKVIAVRKIERLGEMWWKTESAPSQLTARAELSRKKRSCTVSCRFALTLQSCRFAHAHVACWVHAPELARARVLSLSYILELYAPLVPKLGIRVHFST